MKKLIFGLMTAVLLLGLCISTNSAGALPVAGKTVQIPSPGTAANVIVTPSEVNSIAIGSDDKTFYAVDIPNRRLYKSTNGGTAWGNELSFRLTLAGAYLPVWQIAMAPDDVNFVVAITDIAYGPSGPKMVFMSNNGGLSWHDTNFSAAAGEYIGCVDVSKKYSGHHDVAIGTRTGVGTGHLYVLNTASASGWIEQDLPAPPSDVLALKFSPSYLADSSLAVVLCTPDATFFNIGYRDMNLNLTIGWAFPAFVGEGIEVRDATWAESWSPGAGEIVTADLELPRDFNGTSAQKRRVYISLDASGDPFENRGGIFRIDDSMVFTLMPAWENPSYRISSISYWGTYTSGRLLAGEVLGNVSTGSVRTWYTGSPTSCPITDWHSALTTGAGGSGWGNAQVAWSPKGLGAYCGTSSANPTTGGSGWATGQWPRAWLNGVALDRSAFAVCHENGQGWQPVSLVDSTLRPNSPSFDVVILDVPVFSQDDLSWSGDQLGNCPDTFIGCLNPDNPNCDPKKNLGAGCATTAKAMVFNYFSPGWTDPGKLNTCLTENGGYVNKCELPSDNALNDICAPPGVKCVSLMTYSGPKTDDAIHAELNWGHPLIAKVKSGKTKSHYVVITGYNSDTYYINDPSRGIKTTLKDAPYGPYQILSIRTFEGPLPP
jgi:hypothetical protein